MKRIILIAAICGSLFSGFIWASNDFVIEGFDPTQKQAAAIVTPSMKTIHQYANQTFHHEGDPVVGNPNGSVTMVEFFDYRCIHCIHMAPLIANIIKNNPDLRVVLREFPIFGEMSLYAAKAALAARNQGDYFQFHEALMKVGQGLTKSKIVAIAKNQGLDIQKLQTDMNSDAVKQQIQVNQQLGSEVFRLHATPIIFIGKTENTENNPIDFVLGEVTQNQLQKSISNMSH